jgi:acetyltransferase-like isoleucine patch superfamily enzyme
MTIKFLSILFIYTLGTMVCLTIALTPLTYYLYYLILNVETINLFYFLTMPLGLAFFWLLGFFIFITIHGRIWVKTSLPTIKEGSFPISSDINRIYSLRLSADNIAKYWAKSLEWIPFIAQLVLYKQMLKAYGVKFGSNVYISTETRIDGISLIEIGNNVFIGPRAIIGAHINHKGDKIKYKGVKIGNGCFIGNNSVLTPGCQVGDNSIVGAFTVALLDTIIPANETWIGMPAKRLKQNSIK